MYQSECRVKVEKNVGGRETRERSMLFISTAQRKRSKTEQSTAGFSTFQPLNKQAAGWKIDASIPTKECLNDFGTSEWGNSPIYNWYGWNVNNWMGMHGNGGVGWKACACVRACVRAHSGGNAPKGLLCCLQDAFTHDVTVSSFF